VVGFGWMVTVGNCRWVVEKNSRGWNPLCRGKAWTLIGGGVRASDRWLGVIPAVRRCGDGRTGCNKEHVFS
jgi:hypothetical protein